ncbi:MAG: aspartate aminotransferase family protein [Thermoguttaceae bacterium]|nr:aspartate aminotransferase family protein [Thermoguttaceae bacterium]MDW8079591.1 aspartate aminotransferase family protein [Thermoguttaceae bacterium]
MNSQEVIALFDRYVIGNYRRFPVCLVRGEGSYVWDAEGRRYLDFFPGWGCNLLGHCPPRVVEAVREQLGQLIHVPNTWYTEPQGRWAELLSQRSFGGKAFFCNSGAEAVEAAIKLARAATPRGRYKIISFDGSFHGRTFGALSATAQAKYHEGFEPLVPGFVYAPWGDLEAVARSIDEETAAIIVEPVQGEGGIRIAPPEFLRGLRQLADENGLVLIFDEVQTGCGRTGRWFAYQHYDVVPDIMTLAKGVCGGLAGGVMLAKPELAAHLRPGMHASTFGGNPIAARAGIATIETIEKEGLLERVAELSGQFRKRLTELATRCPLVREVRILGLMIGIELHIPGAGIVQACLDRGLLINCTHETVLRLLPAMTLSNEQLEEGCHILEQVLMEVAKAA